MNQPSYSCLLPSANSHMLASRQSLIWQESAKEKGMHHCVTDVTALPLRNYDPEKRLEKTGSTAIMRWESHFSIKNAFRAIFLLLAASKPLESSAARCRILWMQCQRDVSLHPRLRLILMPQNSIQGSLRQCHWQEALDFWNGSLVARFLGVIAFPSGILDVNCLDQGRGFLAEE